MSEANEAQSVDHSNVAVMPPVLYLGALVLGVAAQWWTEIALPIGPTLRRSVAAALLCGGIVFMAGFWRSFRRSGQDPNPNTPSPVILDSGVFRYSRNPAYVSLTAMLVAFGLLLDNAWILFTLFPVLGVMHYGVILREEAYLERKFGEEYLRYKESVRRWL